MRALKALPIASFSSMEADQPAMPRKSALELA
jgi:hypothetical protein